ncbi:hypothetical protein GY45DRAFT_937329 [Cubamyces sp. BRFM 1775]|nr:hypothetical protein GY45DRAFT_937329 [Cubamyces sp. BRFM 1775]
MYPNNRPRCKRFAVLLPVLPRSQSRVFLGLMSLPSNPADAHAEALDNSSEFCSCFCWINVLGRYPLQLACGYSSEGASCRFDIAILSALSLRHMQGKYLVAPSPRRSSPALVVVRHVLERSLSRYILHGRPSKA